MGLFDRVFRGSDEMFAKAEAEINLSLIHI